MEFVHATGSELSLYVSGGDDSLLLSSHIPDLCFLSLSLRTAELWWQPSECETPAFESGAACLPVSCAAHRSVKSLSKLLSGSPPMMFCASTVPHVGAKTAKIGLKQRGISWELQYA